jgi:hypothetical protein
MSVAFGGGRTRWVAQLLRTSGVKNQAPRFGGELGHYAVGFVDSAGWTHRAATYVIRRTNSQESNRCFVVSSGSTERMRWYSVTASAANSSDPSTARCAPRA